MFYFQPLLLLLNKVICTNLLLSRLIMIVSNESRKKHFVHNEQVSYLHVAMLES